MTCQHAACDAEATVKARFGDGYYDHGGQPVQQSYVHYCDACFQSADTLFVLCDVTLEGHHKRRTRGAEVLDVLAQIGRTAHCPAA